MFRRRVAGMLVLVALVVAACGSSSNGSATTTSNSLSGLDISGTGFVRISDTAQGNILVTSKAFTLYHLTRDRTDHSTCTGSCTSTWSPLIAPANVSFGGLTGFSTFRRPDGKLQVAYHGEPLYTYVGDSKPGEENGQGVGGVWFTVKEQRAASGGGSTTTSSSGGGYGY